jgi:hypothetical protein
MDCNINELHLNTILQVIGYRFIEKIMEVPVAYLNVNNSHLTTI